MSLYKSYALQKMVRFFWPTLYIILYAAHAWSRFRRLFSAVTSYSCKVNTVVFRHIVASALK